MTEVAVETEVLEVVVGLVTDVVGEDFLFDIEIGMETSFSTDLELESIEFVALSEKLQGHYGDRVDFVGWIGEMELEDIMGLKVGTLVAYIASCMA